MVDQAVGQGTAGDLSHANRLGCDLAHERRILQCGQLDEPHAIHVGVRNVCRHAQRQPRLAAAAGARQREQPPVRGSGFAVGAVNLIGVHQSVDQQPSACRPSWRPMD
jgi:hypothetical protein